ncbi:uncharacterized protein LACBIDRAFT_322120 [Laccaria bicolor S238N-H82]|uniref:Predicted protein n=1 Tax=Laccaria bicolor (strain S238N-H82 / ATCC MYA-4686) TaxID=486041 RepID=B0CS70_LACBS|nr:uncharacterized protein LACBIDRAFT_322120 [Laccaria bicolor S238N-H82]EDR14795.1 predicted protein [Laccaria bicolor S238N-H82]|eukprot:XP_001875354.1 predicted protein [Laccaria bicolor S238N-H82]
MSLILSPLLIFIAFLLLLLVTLSAPFIHPIYLFRLSVHASSSLFNAGVNASAQFGAFGYCLSAIQVAHTTSIQNLISRTTTAALVIHPIAAGLSFLALLTSLFMLRRGQNGTARLPSLLTLIVGSTAAVLTTIVFLIDVILVAVLRHRIQKASDGDLTLNWGNAVWMILGATVALWSAMLGAVCGEILMTLRIFWTEFMPRHD